MAFIADTIFDNGLTLIDSTTVNMYITDSEATDYTDATTAPVGGSALGSKTGITAGAPGNASTGTGRSVVIPAITDGSIATTGTATHWALTDGTSVLYATGALTSSQSVTSGNTFTLDAVEIFIRDAT